MKMKTVIRNELAISASQQKYRTRANQHNVSNEDKTKILGLLKKLAFSNDELDALNINVSNANCKYHRSASEKFIKKLEEIVHKRKNMCKTITLADIEVGHLRQQILRVENALSELQKKAVSDDQYAMNLKRASIIVAILENRLYVAQHRENYFKTNVTRLQYVIRALCIDRYKFNALWVKIVQRLVLDRKMLTDMTDQAVIAFEKGAEYRKRIDVISKNASIAKWDHIGEMNLLIRLLHMDECNKKFLSNKMNVIQMNDLARQEVNRRNRFKRLYDDAQLDFDTNMNNVKLKAGHNDMESIIGVYMKHNREYFSQFCYLNDLYTRVMCINVDLQSIERNVEQAKHDQVPLAKKHKTKMVMESQLQHTRMENRECQKKLTGITESMDNYHQQLTDLAGTLHCKLTHVAEDFENDAVYDHNIALFFSELDRRLKQVIAFVYLLDDQMQEEKPMPKLVHYVDVVDYHLNEIFGEPIVSQCAECAMDAEGTSQELEEPHNALAVREATIAKAMSPEMSYRMHNISQCELPSSRALLSRSMQ